MAKKKKKAKTKKVLAVGTATKHRMPKSIEIEAAMRKAVEDAMAAGIPLTDSDEIRSRMMAAREEVKAKYGEA